MRSRSCRGRQEPRLQKLGDRRVEAPLQRERQQHEAGVGVDVLLAGLMRLVRLPGIEIADEVGKRVRPAMPRLVLLRRAGKSRRVARERARRDLADVAALRVLGHVFGDGMLSLNRSVRPSMLRATALPAAAMSIGCTWRRTSCSMSASLCARVGVEASVAPTSNATAGVMTRISSLPSRMHPEPTRKFYRRAAHRRVNSRPSRLSVRPRESGDPGAARCGPGFPLTRE